MKKEIIIFLAVLMGVSILTTCGNSNEDISISPQPQNEATEDMESEIQEETVAVPSSSIPVLDEIREVPTEYLQESSQPGTIERVDYQTASYTHADEIQDKYWHFKHRFSGRDALAFLFKGSYLRWVK